VLVDLNKAVKFPSAAAEGKAWRAPPWVTVRKIAETKEPDGQAYLIDLVGVRRGSSDWLYPVVSSSQGLATESTWSKQRTRPAVHGQGSSTPNQRKPDTITTLPGPLGKHSRLGLGLRGPFMASG